MGIAVAVVLGGMLLASFYVAYMSTRTWQVYQTVLVAAIFVGALAMFYLGARTLATHKAWGALVNQRQQELANLEKQLPVAIEERNKLRYDLQKLATDRGGVLNDVAVAGVKEGVVQLTLKSAEHGLAENTVLFAFDSGGVADGGRYRGEFKVVAIGEDAPTIDVAPNLPLTPSEMQDLAAVKGPWTLYMRMPIDDPAAFASLDEAARAALLPKESTSEYANAERRLRDYESFFHDSYVQRALLEDTINKVTGNIERTEAATKQANEDIAYRETEKTNLAADLEKFRYELKAVADYEAALEKKYQEVRQSLKNTYLSTTRRAAELTAAQLRAAAKIEEAAP
jgi:hypothetical protein